MSEDPLARSARVRREREEQRSTGTVSKPRTSPGITKQDWGPKKRYDRNMCPPGYDADIWDLVLFWEQKREEYRYSGPGRPVIYAELEHIVDVSGIRDRGYVDYEGLIPGWVKVTRAVIEYFWDWEENAVSHAEHALSYFCQIGYFDETVDYLLRKAAAERRRKARLEEGN